MRNRLNNFAVPALLVVALGIVVWVNAGDLNPPPGEIKPTNRVQINQQTIKEFPYVISEPGSYVLTSNITGVAAQHGIEISANNVTLDLNGFQLSGAPGGLDGIHFIGGNVASVAVVNGSIVHWSGNGINGPNTRNARLHGLLVGACGAAGIVIGEGASVTDCVFRANEIGLRADGSTVMGCTATNNTGDGIDATNSLIQSNTAVNNGGLNINATSSTVIENHAP